jgi:cyanophycinase-like exopeptidase
MARTSSGLGVRERGVASDLRSISGVDQQARPQRLIAIFGSGETSPTMTSVHKQLTARVGQPRLNAILLDTPFGFQPNADELVTRIVTYFRQHVGCEISLASLRHSGRATALGLEQFLARLSEANYVFAGPGSPTYAVRHWRDTGVRERLIAKIARGGCVAFASAAAIGLGAYALPVYEIYKVGDDPTWTAGLDVLGEIGIRCAVIPHYNNREGGTHDTRYCYMGEERLRRLEAMLPGDLLILGVDEYTACIIDVAAQSVTVRGRGCVTIRRRGSERRWTQTTFPLSELRDASDVPPSTTLSRPEPAAEDHRALDRFDVDGLVAAILEMESVLQERLGDSAAATDRDRVRAEMRHLVIRLGDRARDGGREEVRDYVAPLVDVLLSMRGDARREQRFNDADRLRAILAECGVEVQDTPSGTAWSLVHA